MLIPLICNQCGGRLEVDDTKVLISDDSFIVLSGQQFECPHCGTKYVSDDASKNIHVNGGGIAIGNLSFGGDVEGNIVIGNGNVISNSRPPSHDDKPKKKWWDFWRK